MNSRNSGCNVLALAGVGATVGLYALRVPAWMWLATAANVAVIAVLLTRLHGRTRHAAVAVCITSNVLIGWYVSPENQGPHARLVTGPPSVTYDAQAMRL